MIFRKTGERDGYTVLNDGSTSLLFDFIEMTVLDGEEYAAFCEKESGELAVLRIADDSENEVYETIESDELFMRVCRKFAEEYPDEFDFD